MSGETSSRGRLPLLLDWLILLVGCLTVAIALTGGVRIPLFGATLTSSSGVHVRRSCCWCWLRRAWDSRRRVPFLASTSEDWRRRTGWLYRRHADEPSPLTVPWRASAAAAAGLCAVGGVLLLPQLRQMHSIPDFGDPLLSMWRAGWVFQQLRGDPRGLFNANIFYPEPLTFTYSDSMLLPSLTVAPLLAAGVEPVVVVQRAAHLRIHPVGHRGRAARRAADGIVACRLRRRDRATASIRTTSSTTAISSSR